MTRQWRAYQAVLAGHATLPDIAAALGEPANITRWALQQLVMRHALVRETGLDRVKRYRRGTGPAPSMRAEPIASIRQRQVAALPPPAVKPKKQSHLERRVALNGTGKIMLEECWPESAELCLPGRDR